MTYFIYQNPQLSAQKFPDAIDTGYTLNLGRPTPNASGEVWFLAGREDNDQAKITSLPYPIKIIGVDSDTEIETLAPWLRDWKYKKLGAAADAATKSIISTVPEFERATWESQEREARAYVVDSNTSTPTLDLMAAQRGDTVADLSARVIASADGYRAIAATNLGKLQALGMQVYTQPLSTVMGLEWT